MNQRVVEFLVLALVLAVATAAAVHGFVTTECDGLKVAKHAYAVAAIWPVWGYFIARYFPNLPQAHPRAWGLFCLLLIALPLYMNPHVTENHICAKQRLLPAPSAYVVSAYSAQDDANTTTTTMQCI